MERAARYPLALLLAAAVFGCNDRKVVGPSQAFDATRPMMSRQGDESSPLVLHVVAPQATDPEINVVFGDHYVWLDPSARGNPKLLVFMPGTRAVELAASGAGGRSVGLSRHRPLVSERRGRGRDL
jgi:hypothetical protein